MGSLLHWEGDTLGQTRFSDGCVFNVSAHNRFSAPDISSYCSDEVCVWVDGEILDGRHKDLPFVRVGAQRLAERFLHDPSLSFLNSWEGHFCATIYDRANKRILFASDRYGLRYLYYWLFPGGIAWATQTKAFTAIPAASLGIDHEAVEQFLDLGYLLEGRTWFRGVKLIPTGSVLTYNPQTNDLSARRYWWWDAIKPRTGILNQNEIADELAERFVKAVRRRCLTEDEEVGLQLSGGLDSRFILAALPKRNKPIQAITFGTHASLDIRLAAQAATVRGAEHHIYELTAENWLMPRFGGVWRTDGQLSLQHMQGVEASGYMRSLFDINMSGFAGDLILGGSYLIDPAYLDQKISSSYVVRKMERDIRKIEIGKEYDGLNKTDFYFLQNRVRRFTYNGTLLYEDSTHFRKPFFDNNLIELVYGLPDRLRINSKIYRRALLRRYPEYFRKIPWQKMEAPITLPGPFDRCHALGRRITRRAKTMTGDFWSHRQQDCHDFTDYNNWICREPARSIFADLLFSKRALYLEFFPVDRVKAEWEAQLSGKNQVDRLCRYLTLEIWLQQIFENRYRNGYDKIADY